MHIVVHACLLVPMLVWCYFSCCPIHSALFFSNLILYDMINIQASAAAQRKAQEQEKEERRREMERREHADGDDALSS